MKNGSFKRQADLRVAIVAPSMAAIGGQSVQADILLRGLRACPGVDAFLVPINPELRGFAGELQRLKYMRTLVNMPAYWVSLLRSLHKADIVHVFSASYLSFVISPTPAVVIAKMMGKPVLLNYHSGEAEDHLRRWPSARRLLRWVDRLVVPSGYLAQVFIGFGLRAIEIPNMVEFGNFHFRLRSPLKPRFLVNRNFEPHYNVELVLRAFRVIQSKISAATLTVAGDGPCRQSLQQLAAELKLRDLRFLGRVPPSGMASLYDEHDIWLNGSDVDNMPLSILESFASGVAVVSTDAGGIPTLVENGRNGLLSARGDWQALAANACRLFDEPKLYNCLANEAKARIQRYSVALVIKQWLDLYRDLIGRHAAARE